MFELEKAIDAFLLSIAQREWVRRDRVEEVEAHLRDAIEDALAEGLSEQEAFERAGREFGGTAEWVEEYQKMYSEKPRSKYMNHMSYWLDRRVLMRLGIGLLTLFGMGGLGTYLSGVHLDQVVQPLLLPTLAVAAVLCLSALFPFRRWSRAYLGALRGDADPEVFESAGRIALSLGATGALLGGMGLVAALSDPSRAGAPLADGCICLLYGGLGYLVLNIGFQASGPRRIDSFSWLSLGVRWAGALGFGLGVVMLVTSWIELEVVVQPGSLCWIAAGALLPVAVRGGPDRDLLPWMIRGAWVAAIPAVVCEFINTMGNLADAASVQQRIAGFPIPLLIAGLTALALQSLGRDKTLEISFPTPLRWHVGYVLGWVFVTAATIMVANGTLWASDTEEVSTYHR